MDDKLTPEAAEKILSTDLRNLVKKVASGKTLSQKERDLIKAKAAGCDDSTLIAKTYNQLANLLGISVRTVNRWRKLPGAPEPLKNGWLPVIEWRQFVKANNLRAGVSPQTEALKARKLLAEVEERELKVAVKKGEYVALEQVRQEWTTQVGKARALFEARFLNELPPILSGMDAHAIREQLEKVLMEVYEALHSGGACTP